MEMKKGRAVKGSSRFSPVKGFSYKSSGSGGGAGGSVGGSVGGWVGGGSVDGSVGSSEGACVSGGKVVSEGKVAGAVVVTVDSSFGRKITLIRGAQPQQMDIRKITVKHSALIRNPFLFMAFLFSCHRQQNTGIIIAGYLSQIKTGL